MSGEINPIQNPGINNINNTNNNFDNMLNDRIKSRDQNVNKELFDAFMDELFKEGDKS
ncbi:MAG: hypothetical protein ABIH00_05565 [Armatimonadota bacterium]